MYTMKEAARLAGMNYDTLKFYCKEGLVPNVARDKNNYRIFTDDNIIWLKSLQCFKQSGMGISELKYFMGLSIQGQETLPERKEILLAQKELLHQKMAEIEANIRYIDHKIEIYDGMLEGRIPFVNKLASDD